jgi:hypothetical protein
MGGRNLGAQGRDSVGRRRYPRRGARGKIRRALALQIAFRGQSLLSVSHQRQFDIAVARSTAIAQKRRPLVLCCPWRSCGHNRGLPRRVRSWSGVFSSRPCFSLIRSSSVRSSAGANLVRQTSLRSLTISPAAAFVLNQRHSALMPHLAKAPHHTVEAIVADSTALLERLPTERNKPRRSLRCGKPLL